MRAKEMIPILAEIFNVPFDRAYQIDRSLAEHGLRAKGVGRAWPEMSRVEALHFMLAVILPGAASKAGETVGMWISAMSTIRSQSYIGGDDDLKNDDPDTSDIEIQRTLADDGCLDSFTQQGNVFYDPDDVYSSVIVHDRSDRLPFLKKLDQQNVSLIDFLLNLMNHMENDTTTGGYDVKLSFSTSHLEASVRVHIGFEKYDHEVFLVKNKPDGFVEPDVEMGVRSSVSVEGYWLEELICRTADPLRKGKE